MAREVHLTGYLPDILKKVYEFKEIFKAEEPELELIFEKADIILDECFIDTLDGYGCARWEKMLAIVPKDTDTLELRRLRIKTALNGDTPYTMRSLENKLKTLCGEGNFVLRYANDIYTLSIGLALGVKEQYDYFRNGAMTVWSAYNDPSGKWINCWLRSPKYGDDARYCTVAGESSSVASQGDPAYAKAKTSLGIVPCFVIC